MARKPILTSNEINVLIDEFFAMKCNYNVSLLKIPKISEYIISKGYNIQPYTIRKNDDVRAHINKIRESNTNANYNKVAVYKTLDIQALLDKHTTKESLYKALLTRDDYYRDIANSASAAFKENDKLTKENTERKKDIANLKYDIKSNEEEIDSLKAELKQIKNNNKLLLGIINDYVNPEIANELLVKDGLLEQSSGILKDDVLDDKIIHADTDIKNVENNIIKGLFDF